MPFSSSDIATKESTIFDEQDIQTLKEVRSADPLIELFIPYLSEILHAMENSQAYRDYPDNLKDIRNLPATYALTHFPIQTVVLSETDIYEGARWENPNSSCPQRYLALVPQEYHYLGESYIEALAKSIETFLRGYATAKKRDLTCLREIMNDDRYSPHREILQDIEDQWINGNRHIEKLEISPYQLHRNMFITDAIIDRNFTLLKGQISTLRKRNDLLQDILRSSKPECELWFTGLDEIAQLGPFDVSKVSLKVVSDADKPLDAGTITSKKHMAKRIIVRYEGVKDATTLDLQAFCKEPYKIYETECKLLLALAFWGKDKEKNRGMIEALMKDYKSDCISHLNGMLRTIFKRDKHVKFIDKAKSEIYFTIELE